MGVESVIDQGIGWVKWFKDQVDNDGAVQTELDAELLTNQGTLGGEMHMPRC